MRRRTKYLAGLLVIAAIWVVGLGCWPFVTWSSLNCSCEVIDISSGRIRYRRYLLGLCVYTSVEETSMSRLLSADGLTITPDWRLVYTLSPFVHHSPHYVYHGAGHQVRLVELTWSVYDFTPDSKRQMARDIVYLWQSLGRYYPVDDYLNELVSVLPRTQERTVDIRDLPNAGVVAERYRSKRLAPEARAGFPSHEKTPRTELVPHDGS